jgi:hypothetical protein
MVPLEFFIDIILPAALWPWGWVSLNRNEYQEYFVGGKGGRRVELTTLPSGDVQACSGIAFYHRNPPVKNIYAMSPYDCYFTPIDWFWYFYHLIFYILMYLTSVFHLSEDVYMVGQNM